MDKEDGSISSGLKAPTIVTVPVPKGFEPRYQMLRRTADLSGAPLFEQVDNLLSQQDILTVAQILRCQEASYIEDPASNLSNIAKARFNMLSADTKAQVLTACKLRDFSFACSKLRVTELFNDSSYIFVDV